MKLRDKVLTGILLIMIGMLMGTLLTLYRQQEPDDHAKVKVTEIQRSSGAMLPDTDSSGMEGDPRLLFRKVAQSVTPTVVYIESIVPLDKSDMPNDRYHKFDEDFLDRFFPSEKVRTVGSGVIISGDGYILTNNHVVEGAQENGINVVLNDKRSFRARVVGADPSTDLAVIKIDDENLPRAIIGNSDHVNVGEWVLAVGNPFRLRSTVTAGIISALNRDVRIIDDQLRVESFIQTDAAINKGNSGGALVNAKGELIGINTAIASQTGSYQGYGFAVPVNLAIKVATDLIEFGEVHRAFLGVSMAPVDNDRAEALGMDEIRGVEIISVMPNSAAYEQGLQERDVILDIDGSPVNEANELQEKIAVKRPGDRIHLRIWRDREIMEKDLRLKAVKDTDPVLAARNEEKPEPDKTAEPDDNSGVQFGEFDLGFRIMALSKPEDAKRYDLIITEIHPNTAAGESGLEEGYMITQVNHQKVEDLQTLKDLVAQSLTKKGAVTLTARKDNREPQDFELKH